MPDVSGSELIIVLVVLALLFGAQRIPGIARGLGDGLREFRAGLRTPEQDSED
jgi:sec-independent protein translocase protein TatA